ncbi:hypothetical protein FOH38_24155 [Lysinibacillus fusiformis]|nr:hypothetical protein FOH38_24155 [Lysinibacillus fusiformis]
MLVNLDCPVELLDYQLYQSKSTGKVYCSLKFNNISEKRIKGIKASIYCFDQFGDPVDSQLNSFEYKLQLKESVNSMRFFSTTEKILLDKFPNTRQIDIVINKVLFDDQTMWTKNETELENIELEEIKNPKQLSFVKAEAGNDAKYFSQKIADKWICVCGRLNLDTMAACKRCKKEREEVLAKYSDEETVNQNIKLFEKEKETLRKKGLAEQERLQELFKQKVKKISKYTFMLGTLLLFIGFIVYGFMTKFTFSWENYLLLKDKDNALIEAVKVENLKRIELLLDSGASVNFVNGKGENSISEAIKLPNQTLAVSLMNKNMSKIRIGESKDTLAHIAVKNQQFDILKELHKFGFDMGLENEKGETVLYSAIEKGNKDLVNYLIEDVKVSILELDSEGNNIIQVALLHQLKNTELMKDLLGLDIDFKKENTAGQNTYESAILTQNVDIVRAFMDKGLDLNNVDNDVNNALHIYMYTEKENSSFLTELIKKGTDINGLNKQGHTPLYIAIQNGDRNTVEELLKNKVDVNNVTSDGESAIAIAEKYDKSLVEIFERGKLVVKIDEKKNLFMLNGISLDSSKQDVINLLGNPKRKENVGSMFGPLECYKYNLKDGSDKEDLETEVCFTNDRIQIINFELSNNLLNEKWYNDLGEPFSESDDSTNFYLEGTEQVLLFKHAENVAFLYFADFNFYYYSGMEDKIS